MRGVQDDGAVAVHSRGSPPTKGGIIVLPAAPGAPQGIFRSLLQLTRNDIEISEPPPFSLLDWLATLRSSSVAIMSGEKRPAPEAFGHSSQLVVKRKKSDADLNPGTAVAKSSSQNGALIQSVCGSLRQLVYAESVLGRIYHQFILKVGTSANLDLDSSHERTRCADHGAYRYAALLELLVLSVANSEKSGHSGEVFTVRFDPTAQHIASGSMDRSICTS